MNSFSCKNTLICTPWANVFSIAKIIVTFSSLNRAKFFSKRRIYIFNFVLLIYYIYPVFHRFQDIYNIFTFKTQCIISLYPLGNPAQSLGNGIQQVSLFLRKKLLNTFRPFKVIDLQCSCPLAMHNDVTGLLPWGFTEIFRLEFLIPHYDTCAGDLRILP